MDTTPAPAPSDAPRHPHPVLWSLIGPSFIYGTIIATAVMVVADDADTDAHVLLVVLGSTVVIFVAHLFSELVAGGPRSGDGPVPFRVVLGHAFEHSVGLLTSAALPLIFLLLGALGILSEDAAYYLALAVAVLSLAIVGWISVQHRGYIWPYRLVGALVAMVAGALVIVLKALDK